MERPSSFFTPDLLIRNLSSNSNFVGLNIGYESRQWRFDAFADHLIEWLPEFALKYSEFKSINHTTAVRMLREAAKRVYSTDKYQGRGEFGELILHAIIREIYNSEPAISKIYYKSTPNETVKGFDSVHVVNNKETGLELWLGEAKFYKNCNDAINNVVEELKRHFDTNYLKEEFLLITSKIDNEWEYANDLKELISSKKSLDDIFKKICVPVLLTYESDTTKKFNEISEDFISAIKDELTIYSDCFKSRTTPLGLDIYLFLLPLEDKDKLICTLDTKLKGYQ